jgi:hypothetical protein
MRFAVEQVASVCHEANRQYCLTIGDESQKSWDEAPQWQRDSAMKGVLFHVKQLQEGVEPPPSASHESWLREKDAAGWKYGPVKDEAKKEHPCFVAYDKLPIEQRVKDYLFGAIVKGFYVASYGRRCPKCGIGIDDNGDGDCAACGSKTAV